MEGVEELSASIFRMVSSAWRHRKFGWIGWRFFNSSEEDFVEVREVIAGKKNMIWKMVIKHNLTL